MLLLAHSTGDDLFGLAVAANEIRRQLVGDTVSTSSPATSISPTSVLSDASSVRSAWPRATRPRTSFRPKRSARKSREAASWGATEVCIQGGLPRHLPPFYYRDVLRAVKAATPKMHAHAFSPMEMVYGVELTGMPVREYLLMLKDSGLDTLPGTAAEILDDAVRMCCRATNSPWRNGARSSRQRTNAAFAARRR